MANEGLNRKDATDISKALFEVYTQKETKERVESLAKSLGTLRPEDITEPYTI